MQSFPAKRSVAQEPASVFVSAFVVSFLLSFPGESAPKMQPFPEKRSVAEEPASVFVSAFVVAFLAVIPWGICFKDAVIPSEAQHSRGTCFCFCLCFCRCLSCCHSPQGNLL